MTPATRGFAQCRVWPLVLLAACGQPPATIAAPAGDRQGWVEVFAGRDPENGGALVRIAADTLGARRLDNGGGYLVWIETRHTRPRTEGGRPFDRELLRFLFRCAAPGDGAYKRVSATLLDGERPPVYQEAVSMEGAEALPWQLAKPGTFDLPAFARACDLVTRRATWSPRLRTTHGRPTIEPVSNVTGPPASHGETTAVGALAPECRDCMRDARR